MVDQFRIHHSFKKTLASFIKNSSCEIRFNSDFSTVIQNCAQSTYQEAHQEGFAHSVETWIDGALVGGLYCVSLGKAVFGESMFSLQKDASKIALAALVAFCRAHQIVMIDCQQNTSHLASLGAKEMPRARFIESIKISQQEPAPEWVFLKDYWHELFV